MSHEKAARRQPRERGHEAVNKGSAGVGMWREKIGHFGSEGERAKEKNRGENEEKTFPRFPQEGYQLEKNKSQVIDNEIKE